MQQKKKVTGVYGGSFNPIHLGHTLMADDLISRKVVDEVWFVVSPQNPLKKSGLWDDETRLRLAQLAVSGKRGIRVSDVEFHMPRPSYMFSTLEHLSLQYSDCEFVLVIGADNWNVFQKWYRWQEIINRYRILVLPRVDDVSDSVETMPLMQVCGGRLETVDVEPLPLRNISSTWIRNQIGSNSEYNGEWLDKKVWKEIKKMNL